MMSHALWSTFDGRLYIGGALVLCNGAGQWHPVLSSLISAYSADAPKDNGGSEILKYLLEITDGTTEGDTLETVLHNWTFDKKFRAVRKFHQHRADWIMHNRILSAVSWSSWPNNILSYDASILLLQYAYVFSVTSKSSWNKPYKCCLVRHMQCYDCTAISIRYREECIAKTYKDVLYYSEKDRC